MNHRKTAGTVSAEDYIRLIKRYPTWQVLRACRDLSVKEEDSKDKPWRVERQAYVAGFPKTEWIYVTQFHLALLAKLALLYSDDRRSRDLSPDDLFKLIGYASLLDEPFLHDDRSAFSAWSFLIRTAWWQFPMQSGMRYLLPRYYTMFRTVNDQLSGRKFDVPSAWSELTGMSLEAFMVLGFMLWAHGRSHTFFELKHLQNPQLGKLYELATDDRLARVMRLAGADYQEFRTVQQQYEIDDWLYIQTEFNSLVRRPLILAGKRGCIAPIPRLVLERFTTGLFFDLAERYREEERNEFLEYFGQLFEQYVGLLLRDGWGQDCVIPEPRYGREERRGPDWIVIEGDRALLFECKASRLRLPSKTIATEEEVRSDLRRIFVEPLKRYPRKIKDLQTGSCGIDVSQIRRFYPCVVVGEMIYLEPLLRQFINEELQRGGIEPFDYFLVDINEIELLSAWASQTSVADLLDSWAQDRAEGPPIEFDIWIQRKGEALGLNFDCPRLKDALDQFLHEYVAVPGANTVEQDQ